MQLCPAKTPEAQDVWVVRLRVHAGDVKNSCKRGCRIYCIISKNVCMKLFITTLYLLEWLRNILEEEEWADILKWDRESRLQCHILYCSVLHNLSENEKEINYLLDWSHNDDYHFSPPQIAIPF